MDLHAHFFQVRLNFYDGKYRVSPRQWTDLTNILRSGAAPHLLFEYMDLSILPDNALVDTARCRKLEVSWCDVRGRLLSDDVLRSCAANGVIELTVWANKSEDEHTVSEEALLDFCFPQNGPSRRVAFDNLPTPSDTFAVRFFQRLLAPGCTSAPSGFMVFTGKKEQHGLADYVQCLVPDQPNPTYRFTSLRDGEYAYHFVVDYRNHEYPHGYSSAQMEFSFGYFDPRPTNDDRLDYAACCSVQSVFY
ncbi:hypothetical protein AAVH_33038 [Aphelenchoides avenae]|nr:hypothetical protein AAVH_33038 [Aphelenchus avenae]